MQPALSALLPIRNAQATIEVAAREILEVLSDLTDRLELVIVDDGSTDATPEILPELVSCFPQIRLAHHRRPLGRVAALRTALSRSSGGILFFQDDRCSLALDQVCRLWNAAHQHEIVIGRAALPVRSKWGRRPTMPRSAGNYQLVARPVLEQVKGWMADETTFRQTLLEVGRPWHDVEIFDRGCRLSTGRSFDRRTWADRSEETQRGPRRPNYLDRIKDFAWGE